MSRRTTSLHAAHRDGTSQSSRALPALDPAHAPIDERGRADLLAFVAAFAEQVRYFGAAGDVVVEAGTWRAFANHPTLSAAEIAAFVEDPERFAGDEARWLGRPHFALLLTFVELLRHARDQLNGLTARHLEHYYGDILGMRLSPPEPDRVAVLFQLAHRVSELLVPAGTALDAGRDSAGVARVYRTERDLVVNRARIADLRSVYVDRRITGIPDVRKDASLTAAEAFDGTLRIALGAPRPGDPVAHWDGQAIDRAFFVDARPTVDFARHVLCLEHHELRALMQRVRRQRSADAEWAEIDRLLGVGSPSQPRAFLANLESRVGTLDFKADGLPQVGDIDDVYEHRAEPDVRAFIDSRLAAVGYDNFVALMPIKLRIDAEWAEINRLLERAGRRKRGVLAWSLAPTDPTDFAANLARALDGEPAGWPTGVGSVDEYDARIRSLEAHLSMSVERAQRLVVFAESLGEGTDAKALDWTTVDRILTDAHAEQIYAARRAALAEVRGTADDVAALDRVIRHVLGEDDVNVPWDSLRSDLAKRLDAGQLGVLDTFRDQKTRAGAFQLFEWADVYRVLELAQRYVEAWPEPVARKVEWRNLYAAEDATGRLADAAGSPRWRTFGGLSAADPAVPPAPTLGFALRSPVLGLSQGVRTLTLTLGLAPDGFDRDTFLNGLGIDPALLTPAALIQAFARVFVVEVSTAKGWSELAIRAAAVAAGALGDDYWSLRGVERGLDEDRPALQLGLVVDRSHDALAPIPDGTTPTLRVLLRPIWDGKARQWVTALGPFESFTLAAAHLAVDVEGLTDLHLQQDDRKIDPRKPWEPFGSRPAVGARLYLTHPELVRNRLERLRFDIAWMGLPGSLTRHYLNYPGVADGRSFVAALALVDKNLVLPITDAALFEADAGTDAKKTTRTVDVQDVAGAISVGGFAYTRRDDLVPGTDVRFDDRFLRLDLTPTDFGHGIYTALAAKKAREQAVALSNGAIPDATAAETYRVDAPYTPTIRELSVAYRTSVEILPRGQDTDLLLHVHPFGEARLAEAERSLLPRYDQAGELYIGLAEVAAPQHLSLLVQLAEGTSDPDAEPAAVSWSVLDGDRWRELVVLHDSTRGLINTGIVELELPATAPSERLPRGLYWVRAAIPRDPAGVCDTVDIRAQAVLARFTDGGNAPDHYAQPLPVASVTRLVEPDARIGGIEQPFTSFDGKPGERPGQLRTRVSERLRHKQRALAPWDYERLVLQQFGKIYKAKCLPAARGGVEVVVIPDIRDALPGDALSPKAPANVLADIHAFLAARAPDAAAVRVRNARYVPVLVRLGVRFLPGQDEAFARKRLNEDLVRFLSPWAFEEGVELTIGGSIYANSLIDFVDRRDYVDYVAEIKLFRGRGDGDFALVPVTDDYHVSADGPDEVLVSAREHKIDVIPELGYEQSSFSGLNYMSIELDFIVGA